MGSLSPYRGCQRPRFDTGAAHAKSFESRHGVFDISARRRPVFDFVIDRRLAAAGVHRTTVHHWNRTSADFRAAVKLARQEFSAALDDQLRDLSSAALDTLTTLLTSPETSSAVRLKAALAVLERPHFPDTGWQLPEPVCSTREREVLEGLAEVRRDLMTKGEM
jgi:hypothetical protein